MTLILIIIFSVSSLGILALLVLKRWEIRTGGVLLGRRRKALGMFFDRVLIWVEEILPRLVRIYSKRGVAVLHTYTHWCVAHAVLYTEYLLERALFMLRRATSAPTSQTEVSAFLREVAEHKKRLLRHGRSVGSRREK